MLLSICRVAIIALACGCLPAFAQCTPRWLNGIGIPWAPSGGVVHATTTWDPDGTGPEPIHLVVGGDFGLVAGTEVFGQIAAWNPLTGAWRGFNGQIAGTVYALAGMPNGDLVAAGLFWDAGGTPVHNIARWNGSAWTPIGSGIDDIRALAVLPNGDLIAGGNFHLPVDGGGEARFVARWNGTEWLSMDTQMNSHVNALLVTNDGDLIAGGNFDTAGGQVARRVARWRDGTWTAVGVGPDSVVDALAELAEGELVAAGAFSNAGGAPAKNIAMWNGTNWTPLGSGTDGRVESLAVLPNGDLVAGGRFRFVGATEANNIARWNGTEWETFGSGVSGVGVSGAGVYAIAPMPNGDIIAGGAFPFAGGIPARGLARWGQPIDCLANYNCDGLIDILDFLDFLDDFSGCEQAPSPCGSLGNADVTSDGIVDILDFLEFLDSYSHGC